MQHMHANSFLELSYDDYKSIVSYSSIQDTKVLIIGRFFF